MIQQISGAAIFILISLSNFYYVSHSGFYRHYRKRSNELNACTPYVIVVVVIDLDFGRMRDYQIPMMKYDPYHRINCTVN